jgi:acetyltransferase-like isoleucine patch superfamily enzyme
MREGLKIAMRGLALIAALPALASFAIRRRLLGADRALEGSTQALALVPGLPGQYLRRAFLGHALARCHSSSVVCYGTTFSQSGALIDERAYVGPGCHLGLVHIERDVLIGSGVHVTSGKQTHGTDNPDVPIRDQPGIRTLVRIGAGSWIGSAAVIMANVGSNAVIGAGSVVIDPIPDSVIAAGVPARVIRTRA